MTHDSLYKMYYNIYYNDGTDNINNTARDFLYDNGHCNTIIIFIYNGTKIFTTTTVQIIRFTALYTIISHKTTTMVKFLYTTITQLFYTYNFLQWYK